MLRGVDLSPARTLPLGALLCLLLVGGPLLTQPGAILASPQGEVWGHLWVQGWHAAALPDWPSGTGLALGADPWPVIDPLPTAFAAATGRLIGPVAAWNLLVLGSVLLAFLGGAALAKRAGGEPLVGGLALGLAPSLMGSLGSGLSEDMGVGLAALGLSRLGSPRLRDGALAGLLLGLLAGTGLLLAWATALVAGLLGLAAAWEDRRTVKATALAALIAAALALPVAWPHAARLSGLGHRGGSLSAADVEPLWRLNPWRGVDLLSLVAPLPQEAGEALIRVHPGYLGLTLLGLALLGARGARIWALILLLLAAAALGPELRFGGHPLGFGGNALGLDNPVAAIFSLLPGGSLLNHHGRLLLVGAIALSVLASRGARVVGERLGRRALLGLSMAAAVDLVLLAPGGAPLPLADPAPADIVTELGGLRPGALLVVPAAGPGVHFQRPLFDQRLHGRRLLLDPRHPGLPPGLASTPTGRWLGSLAQPRSAPPPTGEVALPGVAVLVVLEPYVEAVEAVLGEPTVRADDGAAWER